MTLYRSKDQTTILVVDDERIVTDVLNAILTRAGFRVEVARGGREGVEAAERVRPDFIIMDIRMPDLDGIRAACEIRCKPEMAQVPILFLSGEAVEAIDGDQIPGPAPDVLSKPFSSSKITSIVQASLKGATRIG